MVVQQTASGKYQYWAPEEVMNDQGQIISGFVKMKGEIYSIAQIDATVIRIQNVIIERELAIDRYQTQIDYQNEQDIPDQDKIDYALDMIQRVQTMIQKDNDKKAYLLNIKSEIETYQENQEI